MITSATIYDCTQKRHHIELITLNEVLHIATTELNDEVVHYIETAKTLYLFDLYCQIKFNYKKNIITVTQ